MTRFLFLVLFLTSGLYAKSSSNTILQKEQIIALLMKQKLEVFHFSKKKIDDYFSTQAFTQFMQRIDYDKRFLLHEDVSNLRKKYASKIDDEMTKGQPKLYLETMKLIQKRAKQIKTHATMLLEKPFNFDLKEYLETDAKKRKYARSLAKLKIRWERLLKSASMNEYISLKEGQEKRKKEEDKLKKKKIKSSTKPKPYLSEKELKAKARKEVKKSIDLLFSRILKETPEDYFDLYINAVSSVFDPHTSYMPPDRKEDFDIEMSGSLEGIGALLREDEIYIKVVRIIPGSASWRQKQLKAGDIILKVAQGDKEPVDIVDVRVRKAVKLIRGPKGTEVRLTVRKPDGREVVIPIIRDIVNIEETYAKGVMLDNKVKGINNKVGYIRLSKFYRDFENMKKGKPSRNSTDDIRKEIEKFNEKGVKGVIIDLRYNGGGALQDARQISGLFIKKGPIVQVKRSDGHVEVLEDNDNKTTYDGPLVILINKFSASASEILAAALQDYGRAIIVGTEHSHGKGTVQMLFPLDYALPSQFAHLKPLGVLKVTTQKFYRINGRSTQVRGVTPHIILPDSRGYYESGEKELEHALVWDTVPALKYDPWKLTKYDIPKLLKLSQNRVKQNKQFNKIKESVKVLKINRKKTLKSLHMGTALAERRRLNTEAEKLAKLPSDPILNDETENEEKKDDKELTEAEKEIALIKKMRKDPYINESINILNDMISLGKTMPQSK